MRIILYTKPGCHLCEGLQQKLEQIIQNLNIELVICDITSSEDWFKAYQYEVPVLYLAEDETETLQPIPRPSPRANVKQLEQLLLKYIPNTEKNNAK
jgi:glutaredoxin